MLIYNYLFKKHLNVFLLLVLLFLLPFFLSQVFAQDSYRGLISQSFMQIADNGNLIKTNKPLIIIYNRNYCSLYIGDKSSHFPVESYSTKIKEGNVEEGFLSGETSSTKFGWYSITILHNNNGESDISIQLPSVPGGAAYFVQKAKVYSENGKVNGKVFVNNWKQLDQDFFIKDSINNVERKRKIEESAKAKYIDSLNHALMEKERTETELKNKMINEEKLNTGNNLYSFKSPNDERDFTKKIDSAVSMNIRNIFKIGKIKLFINKNGNVDSCANVDYYEAYIDKINPIIKELNLKVEPFIVDGKAYPSYAIVYLHIDQYFYENNRRRKKHK